MSSEHDRVREIMQEIRRTGRRPTPEEKVWLDKYLSLADKTLKNTDDDQKEEPASAK
jgi:hypothetical protein